MKTIIMAGGRGTRISSIASDIPKPMIEIEGRPVLEHEIECLREQGFSDIILTVSHKRDAVISYFGDGNSISPASGRPFGVHISYFIEEKPLGNAGALFLLRERGELEGDFLLLNGDAVFDIDFNRFVRFHQEHRALATLFTHPNSHPYDSGLIVADENHQVISWLAKEDVRPEFYKNRVNAGLHVINAALLDSADIDPGLIGTEGADGAAVKADLDRQLLKPLAGSGRMFCYDSPEYVKDMGTPERLHAVIEDFRAGRVQARSLKHPQRAVFLDRDGTINKKAGFLCSVDAFELLPGAAQAVKRINDSGWLAVVITNQPVVARGEVTVDQLNEIHNKMEMLLGLEGAYIDALYYCPHHPDRGFAGEVRALKIDCSCRKPKPGLLLKAAEDLNIDLGSSWMIGDSWRDVQAGAAAGCRTVYLTGGSSGQESRDAASKEEQAGTEENLDGRICADCTAASLPEAVKMILG